MLFPSHPFHPQRPPLAQPLVLLVFDVWGGEGKGRLHVRARPWKSFRRNFRLTIFFMSSIRSAARGETAEMTGRRASRRCREPSGGDGCRRRRRQQLFLAVVDETASPWSSSSKIMDRVAVCGRLAKISPSHPPQSKNGFGQTCPRVKGRSGRSRFTWEPISAEHFLPSGAFEGRVVIDEIGVEPPRSRFRRRRSVVARHPFSNPPRRREFFDNFWVRK